VRDRWPVRSDTVNECIERPDDTVRGGGPSRSKTTAGGPALSARVLTNGDFGSRKSSERPGKKTAATVCVWVRVCIVGV